MLLRSGGLHNYREARQDRATKCPRSVLYTVFRYYRTANRKVICSKVCVTYLFIGLKPRRLIKGIISAMHWKIVWEIILEARQLKTWEHEPKELSRHKKLKCIRLITFYCHWVQTFRIPLIVRSTWYWLDARDRKKTLLLRIRYVLQPLFRSEPHPFLWDDLM
jgi:hypothetical protein